VPTISDEPVISPLDDKMSSGMAPKPRKRKHLGDIDRSEPAARFARNAP